jgi:hemerythrin superfamily protein
MVTTEQREQDVVAILMQDHREVEAMFNELNGLRGSREDATVQRRKDLAEQVVIELVRHSVAEEAEVYPRIRERIDPAEADRLIHEQSEAELTMKRLEKLDADQPEFEAELQKLMSEIKAHVAEEEQVAFPRLREVFSADELADMGRKVQAVKKTAPTRPHPSAPDQPPGNKALGPMAGMVDRIRDSLAGRGTE